MSALASPSRTARPLRHVVLATILALVSLSSLALFLVVDAVVTQKLHAEALAGLQDISVRARNRVDHELYERYRDVVNAGRMLEKTDLSGETIQNVIDDFTRDFPEYSWVSFVSPQGIVEYANRDLLKGLSVAQRPWFQPSLSAPYVGDVHEAQLLQKLLHPANDGQVLRFIDFATPVYGPDRQVVGVLGTHLDWGWAGDLLQPLQRLGTNSQVYDLLILDHEGRVLHGPLALRGKVLPNAGPLVEGAVWEADDGVLSAVSQSSSNPTFSGLGWYVVAQAHKSTVFALAVTVRDTIFVVSALIFILALGGGILLSRRLARPIEALEQAITQRTNLPSCLAFQETASLSRSFQDLLALLSSEKDAVEVLVQERTEELQDLLKALDAHSIVSMSDPHGNITFCNDQFCSISGYTREELIGNNHRMVKSNIHPPEFYHSMWKTIKKGEVWQGVLCNKAKDGTLYWVQSTISPTHQTFHNGSAYISIRTDVTSMMLTQQALDEKSRQLDIFRRIIDTTEEAVSLLDGDGHYVYCNPAREALTGFSLDELKGNEIAWSLPASSASMRDEIWDAVSRGQSWRGFLPMRRKDGSVFISESNIGVICQDEQTLKPLFIFNVFHDHTQELERTQELEDARNRAIEANQAKSVFLSNMSHELRTPLNAILGFAQLMLNSPRNPVTDLQRRQISYILKGGEHLLELINEVLDLAKIEAGKMSLSLEPLSLGGVVEEALMLSDKAISSNGITVQTADLTAMPVVLADLVRAKQVVVNIISNAAKYNRPNGTIRIFGEQHGAIYRLTIADTGYGIAHEKMGLLFKPFSRLGAEVSDIEGTGVGLALCKTLMEIMGGQIGVDSVPNEGSQFWLDFKIPDRDEQTETSSLSHDPVGLTATVLDHTGVVLYIEDNPANIALMEQIFSEFSTLSLRVAQSAEDGLPMVEDLRPALIIMDLNLPGMNGIQALAALKRNPGTRDIPVIALTADATSRTRLQAQSAGFSAFLSKPVSLGELTGAIDRLLSQASFAEQLR